MKHGLVLLVVAGACLAGVRAYAHHSFSATYLETKDQTVEGEIVQFMWRNPHSFVHVMAKDDKGQLQRYAVEWGGLRQLSGMGVTRDTLKPGDHVIVTGNVGRNPGDHRLRLRTIVRPSDGWRWSGEVD